MVETRYSLGAIPSPHDPRDYPLTRVAPKLAAFPEEFCLPAPPDAPYDQDIYPMCVAFSLALCKAVQEYKERGAWGKYSFGYIYTRREPTHYQGDGMVPREALSTLNKYGVPAYHAFPLLGRYGTLKPAFDPLREDLDRQASAQKVAAYVAVKTVEEIKTALTELGPVSICIPVYDSFYAGGHLPLPDTSKEHLNGYHEVTIMGWQRDNRWRVLNSWGPNWGPLKGWCTIPFNYPIMETWSITDAAPSDPRITLKIGSNEYRLGSRTYRMDVAPFLQGDRTFVPVRFLSEVLGCGVDWRPETQEVIITPPVR